MHEMGIALEIVDIVIKSVPCGFKPSEVEKINIKVGKLSTVNPESLTFCFGVAKKDSVIYRAKLSLEVVPVIIYCKKCKSIDEIKNPIFKCNNCGDTSIDLVSGKELDIVSIEIEKKD